VVAVAVEVEVEVAVVGNFELDGICRSIEVVSCGRADGKVDDLAGEEVVTVVEVKFVGSIVVISMDG